MAHGRADIEHMNAVEPRRPSGIARDELEALAQIGMARAFRVLARELGRNAVAPEQDVVGERRENGMLREIDLEASGEDHRVEIVLPFRRRDAHAIRARHNIRPGLREVDREIRMYVAAEHRLVRRRRLLAEDVGLQTPAIGIAQARKGAHEARIARTLRLVDLRQMRPAHEHRDLGGAAFERRRRAVERRGTRAEHADAQP